MKTFIIIVFTIFLSLLTNCSGDNVVEVKQHFENAVIFDRENALMEVLDIYNISTDNLTLVLMPPTKCASCKLGAIKCLDTLTNVIILTKDTGVFTEKNAKQKCIYYDESLIGDKGLIKLYSALIYIKNRKVIKYIALL